MTPGLLEGRVAVLVGGGGGIGAASALAFAREGARVVVGDLDGTLAEAAAEQVRAAGGEAWGARVDALDEAQLERLLDDVRARYGPLDVMHCLPSTTVLAPSLELALADLERVLRVTVVGQFAAARAAARRLVADGRPGSIVTMASIGGFGGLPRRAAYTASAAAIVNLTRTLGVEWAPHGIRVNAIAPAWTMTPALANYRELYPDTLDFDALAERIPLGRFGRPEEMADVAVFLASDASRFVTGTTILVDGGVTAYVGPGGRPSDQ